MVIAPMLAAPASAVPHGEDWRFEPKLDGFRTILEVGTEGRWRLVSRHGGVWTERFPELAEVGRYIDAPAILDGETVVLGENGLPSFER